MPRTTRTSGRKRCSARRGSNTPSRPGKSQWRSVSFDIEYILKYMIINVWINWINYNSILFNVWINNITIQRNLNIWTWFWNLLECFGTFFFSSRKMTPKCPVVSRCVPVTCPGRSSTGGGFEAPCYRFTGIFGWTFGKVNPWLSIGYPCCFMLLPNEKTSCFAMDTSQKVAIVQWCSMHP